jgi:hypothetical protein
MLAHRAPSMRTMPRARSSWAPWPARWLKKTFPPSWRKASGRRDADRVGSRRRLRGRLPPSLLGGSGRDLHTRPPQLAAQVEHPPKPVFALRWDGEARARISRFAPLDELPGEVREVFERAGYGCLPVEAT